MNMIGASTDAVQQKTSHQSVRGPDDMYDAIAHHGSPRGAQAETDALVDELLPGYRRSTAA